VFRWSSFALSILLTSSLLPGKRLAGQEASSSSGKPSFLQHFDEGHRTLLVIRDLLPHLQKLLKSHQLREVILNGHYVKWKERFSPTKAQTDRFVPLWDRLDAAQKFIPTEIVAGISDASLEDLHHFIRFWLLVGLCRGALEAGDKVAPTALKGLQGEMLKELKRLKVPGFTLWVSFRQEQQAQMIVQLLTTQVSALRPVAGVKLWKEPGFVGIEFNVSAFLDEETKRSLGVFLGAARNTEDAAAEQAGAEAGNVPLKLWLEKFANGLRLTIGPKPEQVSTRLSQKALGALYASGPEEIAFAIWHLSSLKSAAKDLLELWSRWQTTPVGQATKQLDDEDLLGSLVYLARSFTKYGDAGSARLWAGEALMATVQEEGVEAAPDLSETTIPQALPADTEGVFLSSRTSFADNFKEMLTSFEDRLSLTPLTSELRGHQEAAEILEAVSRAYHAKMAAFRHLVFEEAETSFLPPVAYLIGTKGQLEELLLKFMEGDREKSLCLKNQPATEYAVITRVKEKAEAQEVIQKIYDTFMTGLLAALDRPLIRPTEPTPVIDIGIGIPVRGFSAAWISSISGDTRLRIETKGDLLPHFFVLDDLLVLSTSPRLSRSVLAAYRGKAGGRLLLPKAPEGRLIGYGHSTGETVGIIFNQLSQWFEELTKMRGEISPLEPAALLLKDLGTIVRLGEKLHYETTDKNNVRTTNLTFSFRPQ